MNTKALVIGSFDLTHAGHFHLFELAAGYADEVHVGVAHDALVRAFKGADRPIYPIEQRVWILERCSYVDHVHIYGNAQSTKSDNDTEQKILVEKIEPHLFVEGEDKQGSVLRGYLEKKGIERISTPRLGIEVTTSHFIKKIRQQPHPEASAQDVRDVSRFYDPT